MTLKQLLENRLEDLEAEAKRVCGNDEGAYYAFYELEIEALKKEIAKAEQEVNMLIKNTLNIDIFNPTDEELEALMEELEELNQGYKQGTQSWDL